MLDYVLSVHRANVVRAYEDKIIRSEFILLSGDNQASKGYNKL